jgi:hypothetical protein
MGQRIWFLLFSSNGQILEGTSISSVPLSSDDLIVQFRDAVKAKFADSLLQGIAPANLKVYENRQAFDSRKSVDEKEKNEPLHPTRTLHGLGTENNALIIEVPSSLPRK